MPKSDGKKIEIKKSVAVLDKTIKKVVQFKNKCDIMQEL